ncbi:MAG: O-antigen ligase family protein [Burkholderiaceae bacterium]
MKPFSLGSQGVAALIALMQAVPAGHGLGNFFFFVRAFKRAPEGHASAHSFGQIGQSFQDFRHVLIAAYVMTALHLLILLSHNAGLREFEAYAVWLIWPFVLVGLLKARLKPAYFFVGLALAGCVSGIAGVIDLIGINLHPPEGAFVPNSGALRVAGSMSNPLVFGNLSLLFASCCLYLMAVPKAWCKIPQPEPHWLWLLGLFLGLLASLLSGTKGGWLAAALVWPFLLFLVLRHRPLKLFLLTLLVLLLSFFSAASLPMSSVSDRFVNFYHALAAQVTMTSKVGHDVTATDPSRASSGNHGALGGSSQESSNKPSQTSEAVSESVKQPVAHTPAVGIDSSVTPRLVQWRLAFSETSAERLLIGMPRATFIEMQRQALDSGQAQGLIRPWRNLHNDLIDAFITKGIFGLLSLVVFVVLTIRFFYCRLKSENEQIQSFASLGLLVLAMVALFSISDVQLDKGAVTHTLTFLLLTLTALILQHENELPAHRL